MRTSQILAAAMTTIVFLGLPAVAETAADQSVSFEIDLNASPADIYQSIRKDAGEACTADRNSSSVTTRMYTRRKCQTRLIEDVLAQLERPAVSAQAKNDGLCLAGAPS